MQPAQATPTAQRPRILLALDDASKAAATALELTQKLGAELTVLFVLDAGWNVYVGHDWLSGSNSRADFLDWIKDEETKAADGALADFRQLAGSVEYTERTAAGDVQKEILKEAALGYDLLIMSSPFGRGLEVVRKAATHMAEHCPCSLMLVKR